MSALKFMYCSHDDAKLSGTLQGLVVDSRFTELHGNMDELLDCC